MKKLTSAFSNAALTCGRNCFFQSCLSSIKHLTWQISSSIYKCESWFDMMGLYVWTQFTIHSWESRLLATLSTFSLGPEWIWISVSCESVSRDSFFSYGLRFAITLGGATLSSEIIVSLWVWARDKWIKWSLSVRNTQVPPPRFIRKRSTKIRNFELSECSRKQAE